MPHPQHIKQALALLTQLELKREPSYAHFNAIRIKVSSHPESVLGIRMRHLRQASHQLAKLLSLDEAVALLHERATQWYEYKIIFGGLLGHIATASQGIPFLYPLCDGWATPDYYREVLALWAKRNDDERETVLHSITQHANDSNPYARRLTVVAWLDIIRHGLATPEDALQHITALQDDKEYYVQMAIAWLLAEMTIQAAPTDPTLMDEILRQISNATVVGMYEQKLRDSLQSKTLSKINRRKITG